MKKILGIDTGTNSHGWAIVGKGTNGYCLLDKGVNIFQEGVKIEKGKESSKASERTMHRASRVRYYRIKLRKIRLLRILSDNHLCPPLTSTELSAWRLKKIYPKNELFMKWQSTDDNVGINPYAYRHKCLHEKLDWTDLSDRYVLGRAFYHIIQRRGFLSNRKIQNGDETGKVNAGISSLTEEMKNAGFKYLGDYFYHLYNKGEKIRNHYTARNEHYLAEFKAICEMQNIDQNLANKIEKAIFDQRPLKSQKSHVGKCVFEKNKAKCSSSHPMYEEFRMLSFVNNIRIRTPRDSEMRPLTNEERKLVMPLFFRKLKKQFDFEDIAKKLAPKRQYGFIKKATDSDMPYQFNYPMDTSVSGCPVTAALKGIFGDNWIDGICKAYTLGEGKTRLEIVNDIWHALSFYSDKDKLAEFAKDRLLLDDKNAKAFSGITMPSAYASLSLKAICKILPFLRRGIIYSHAVFLGNLCEVMPSYEWGIKEMREAAIDNIIREMGKYDCCDERTFEACIKGYIREQYNVSEEKLKKLYHPSMIDVYPQVRSNAQGEYRLGSPRIDSIRNPMAMRAIFRLRKLVNRLLEEGKIDSETEIHIELARELNDANKRKAIADFTKANKEANDKARKEIVNLYKQETGMDIEPTDSDILKYNLWEEQKHICIYTGKQIIRLSDFIGENPKFDIEHTIPRSVGGDSTRMNLTLCENHFNRETKNTKLPVELDNHDEIMSRIKSWKEKYESLESKIRKLKGASKCATTKEAKDNIISQRHLLELRRDYWKGKYERFTMDSVPEGFSRRQGTDIGIISKYARLYLKSLFKHVYTVNGISTSDFRKIWGIQDIYGKKERINHVHHCIDAIVIACISPDEYSKLGAYYHDEENYEWYGASKPSFTKPWSSFVEDIKKIQDEILVYHYTPDNMAKQGRKRIKINGEKVSVGDVAREVLHQDTYYGAIENKDEIKYVRRIELSKVNEKNAKTILNNIVDDTVRDIVNGAVKEKGLKKAMAGPIWMNEEKRIPIKKVRYFVSVKNPLSFEKRKPRDLSDKEYRRNYYVATEGNHMIALYVGKSPKGKKQMRYELCNNMEAANFYRVSNAKKLDGNSIVPDFKENCKLAFILRKGTMVIFYKENKEDVWNYSQEVMVKNLYYVSAIESDGRVTFKYHQEARKDKEIPKEEFGIELKKRFRLTSAKILVQGYDFEINELGEIKRLR